MRIHKHKASAAEKVRVAVPSSEERKAHNKAVHEARMIGKLLCEAADVVVVPVMIMILWMVKM
jgi:hypothetical protein